MSADVFACALLGCLFALGAVAIATWQIASYRFKRMLDRALKGGDVHELLDMAMGHPQLGGAIIAAVRRHETRHALGAT
jgi:hypothetical protein